MEPEGTKPEASDVLITPRREEALARQIKTEGAKLFKLSIGTEQKFVVAKTRHRALLGAANEILTIEQVSERDLMRMIRESLPDLVQRIDGSKQMTLPFSEEGNE